MHIEMLPATAHNFKFFLFPFSKREFLFFKPMLTTRNGEVEPAGQPYKRSTGVKRLYRFVKDTEVIQEAVVVYSTTLKGAQDLDSRISAPVPAGRICLAKMGSLLGVHGGPGAQLVALRTGRGFGIE
ncbi:DegV family protein [Thermodesulfobacteriota bacterium]